MTIRNSKKNLEKNSTKKSSTRKESMRERPYSPVKKQYKSTKPSKPTIATQATQSSTGNEVLYGAHAIIEMLKAKRRRLVSIYTTKPYPRAWERIQQYLPASVPNIQYVSRDVLDRLAGCQDHMGVVAWVTPFKYAAHLFDPAQKPFILLLDAIQDVGNLGAILRTAYCTGVQGVVLCKSNSAQLSAAVCKASAGLSEHLDVYVAPSVKHAAQELKKRGYNLYMTVINGQRVDAIDIKAPCCVVIGNEASGITKEIIPLGTPVTLPQKTADISYNASVATGIILFSTATKLKII